MTAVVAPAECLITSAPSTPNAGPAAGRGGHGIEGMRERVGIYGGEFHAGPRPGARLPGHRPVPAGGFCGMTDLVRVLVADDQALVRGSFRVLVDTAPDLTVVGEAATGAEAVERAGHAKPRVVLMDVRIPVMDGIEATRRITAADPDARVLTLIGLGLSNIEIAQHLHVTLSTAKTHVGRLLMKLNARDRAQLVIAAYETGLVRTQATDA